MRYFASMIIDNLYLMPYKFVIMMPIVIITLFFISLGFYISAKRQNKKVPGTFQVNQIERRKVLLIISTVFAVFTVTVITVIVCLAVIMMGSVEFM